MLFWRFGLLVFVACCIPRRAFAFRLSSGAATKNTQLANQAYPDGKGDDRGGGKGADAKGNGRGLGREASATATAAAAELKGFGKGGRGLAEATTVGDNYTNRMEPAGRAQPARPQAPQVEAPVESAPPPPRPKVAPKAPPRPYAAAAAAALSEAKPDATEGGVSSGGGSCSFRKINRWICGSNTRVKPCTVGGCPFEEKFGEVRANGWMVRAEPCGDFWVSNPAWSGLHITMTSIQAYSQPMAKFDRLATFMGAKKQDWHPPGMNYIVKKKACGLYAKQLVVKSPTLKYLGAKLTALGFRGIMSNYHISIAHPSFNRVLMKGYQNNPTYKALANQLKRAQWQLVLVYLNNKTKAIEKHKVAPLRQ